MAYLEDFLKKRYTEYAEEQVNAGHRIPSQADFGRHIGKTVSLRLGKEVLIPPTTFSQWATGNRPPTQEYKRYLCVYFGPVIYDELGEPREMPIDPITNTIVDTVATKMDRDTQRIARDIIVALGEGKLPTDAIKNWLGGGEEKGTKATAA